MAVALFHPDLLRYLDGLVPPRPPELIAMEAEAERTDFLIIGPAAGYFCYLVTRLIGARSVFELGSGFGYRRHDSLAACTKTAAASSITRSGTKSYHAVRAVISQLSA